MSGSLSLSLSMPLAKTKSKIVTGFPHVRNEAIWFESVARTMPFTPHTPLARPTRARPRLHLAMGGTADAAEDFLEDYYDVVVLSTGLGSSILAA